ncbi:MAG: pantoate--beta-alanine ligase [Deltaproteobacteria bacterium]|nr:pantoate--beta-alanine ligase [Deltaproteobacteria bacterium]
MKLVHDPSEIAALAAGWRGQGLKIALVPTMGWFHAGHLALMRQARQKADRVVVSLFVNPIQFGPGEDLAAYPRDLQRDRELAAGEEVDVLYAPSATDMYPPGFQTTIRVVELGRGLCGASRPGHFDGVCTVVMKLLHQTQPHLAVFGEKDFQQLAVIRRMVRDLDLAVDIVGHPIVREASGLAMSSRNSYLTEGEKEQALCLHRAILFAQEKAKGAAQSLSAAVLCCEIEDNIRQVPGCVVEYVEIVDADSLERCETVGGNSRLIMAVKVHERVRLIDNTRLCEV